MSKVILRPAKKSDAADLALLDNIAGHGLSLWFWKQQCGSGTTEDAMAFGRKRLSSDDAFYGWRNITVAVDAELIVGMMSIYEMPAADNESDKIKNENPVFKPLFELYEKAENMWFIDSLSVYPDARGKKIGSMMFDHYLEVGRQKGYKTMGLVAEDANSTALALYKNRGFKIIDTRKYIEFDGPSTTNEWWLMSKKL